MKYITEVNDQEFTIEIIDENRVKINGQVHEVNFEAIRGQLTFSLLLDGKSYEANIYQEHGGWEVLLRGMRYSVHVEDERERKLKAAAGEPFARQETVRIQAPMPGLVVEIPVEAGQEVQEGDVLLVLESMKMQNELTAPRVGTVTRIMVAARDNVERKQTLLVID